MKTLRLAIFVVVALAQLALPASMVWKRQRTVSYGRVWKFRTAPADPIDIVRGRYLRLRFAAEEFAWPKTLPNAGRTVYVRLKEDDAGFAIVQDLSDEPLPAANNDVVPVDLYGSPRQGTERVHFGFDEMWVTEANASAAETAYRDHSRQGQADAYATVRIRDGDAAIEQLFIANKPLREFLRARP
jgi:uncharacterized membrane-anchored protein